MSVWSVYLSAYGLLLGALTLLWLLSVRLRNASIVDPFWGTTFVIATHDPRVMRQARRLITLRDGQVVEDKRKNGGE